jgi:hypothetical protein
MTTDLIKCCICSFEADNEDELDEHILDAHTARRPAQQRQQQQRQQEQQQRELKQHQQLFQQEQQNQEEGQLIPQQQHKQQPQQHHKQQPLEEELFNLEFDQSNLELDQSNLELDQSNLELDQSNLELDPSNLELDPSNLELNQSNQELNPSNLELDQSNPELDQSYISKGYKISSDNQSVIYKKSLNNNHQPNNQEMISKDVENQQPIISKKDLPIIPTFGAKAVNEKQEMEKNNNGKAIPKIYSRRKSGKTLTQLNQYFLKQLQYLVFIHSNKYSNCI